MRLIKKLLLTTAVTGLALSASAQTSEEYERTYPFVSLQAGTQATFTHYKLGKLLTPIVGINAGSYYTPVVGTRFSANGWRSRTGVKSLNKTYDYNYVGMDIDMLFNLSNAFKPKTYHKFNVVFIAGVGMTWTKYGEEMRQLHACDQEGGGFNFRGGFQFDYDIARDLSVNLEILGTGLHDNFNVKRNGRLDWQASAMVGITYKWRKRTNRSNASSALAQANYDASRNAHTVVPERPTVTEENNRPVPPPAPRPEPQPTPEPVAVQPASTKAEVFFTINSSSVRSSESGKLAAFAEWLKAHPQAKATLTAYADAGTGTAAVNRAVSRRRAASVKRTLVTKYGIAADRITTDFKGDTVQPFADNDRNRVTICVAEE